MQVVAGRYGLGRAFEQTLAGPPVVDVEVDLAGIDGVAVDPAAAGEPRVVVAVTPVAARDEGPGTVTIPGIVEGIAEAGPGRADPFAPVIDIVVEPHDQVGIGGRAGDVAQPRHLTAYQLRILAELDPAGERGIVRDHREGLALRRRQLRLEAGDIGLEAGRTSGQPGAENAQRADGSEKTWFDHGKCPWVRGGTPWGCPPHDITIHVLDRFP